MRGPVESVEAKELHAADSRDPLPLHFLATFASESAFHSGTWLQGFFPWTFSLGLPDHPAQESSATAAGTPWASNSRSPFLVKTVVLR